MGFDLIVKSFAGFVASHGGWRTSRPTQSTAWSRPTSIIHYPSLAFPLHQVSARSASRGAAALQVSNQGRSKLMLVPVVPAVEPVSCGTMPKPAPMTAPEVSESGVWRMTPLKFTRRFVLPSVTLKLPVKVPVVAPCQCQWLAHLLSAPMAACASSGARRMTSHLPPPAASLSLILMAWSVASALS